MEEQQLLGSEDADILDGACVPLPELLMDGAEVAEALVAAEDAGSEARAEILPRVPIDIAPGDEEEVRLLACEESREASRAGGHRLVCVQEDEPLGLDALQEEIAGG